MRLTSLDTEEETDPTDVYGYEEVCVVFCRHSYGSGALEVNDLSYNRAFRHGKRHTENRKKVTG